MAFHTRCIYVYKYTSHLLGPHDAMVTDHAPTMELNSVFGTRNGCTLFLTIVLCSKAYANDIKLASLKAGPMKLRPNLQ